MSCWGQAGANDCSSSPLMGDFPVPRPDPKVLWFPFYSDCWERGELQRELGSPALLPVCALAEPALLGGEGRQGCARAARAVGLCRAQRLPSHKPQPEHGDRRKCDGMGLALRVRRRWDLSQSPRMLKLYLFILGRECWVLCSLSPALSGVSNREWD